MLKINASFSKKVPVQGQDYSSQSYHATIEAELPDGLNAGQLRERIHQTFELVRTSVEDELRQTDTSQPAAGGPFLQSRPDSQPGNGNSGSSGRSNGRSNGSTASPRQLDYLRDLGARQGWSKAQLDQLVQERHSLAGVNELTRNQASALIDELTETNRRSGKGGRRAA